MTFCGLTFCIDQLHYIKTKKLYLAAYWTPSSLKPIFQALCLVEFARLTCRKKSTHQ